MRRILWAAALAIAVIAAAWPPATVRASSSASARTRTLVVTSFTPSRNGFAYRNPRPDPSQSPVKRFLSGRCGGMTYAALDAYSAGRKPRAAVDSPELFARSAESIVANFGRFALWSAWPERRTTRARGTGIGSATRTEELPRLADGLRRGPVALGLVRARSLAEIGRNHQVVAYAVDVRANVAVISIYDSCQPGNDDVRLVVDLAHPETPIREYASGYVVATWRGVFVESYVPPHRLREIPASLER